MAKVRLPLMSGDASGKFGDSMIYRRGGVVTRTFRPRNPKSAAQEAHRQAFKEYYMASLTQAQADLLYSAILHQHDELYAALGHSHDHGDLSGLGDDDHSQYFNETRGDARYLRTVPQQDHGGLSGLGDDDHSQYFNEVRGDARYLRSGVALSWTNATLQNSWVSFGSPYASAGYSKDGAGIVRLRGAIKSGTSGAVAFTLASGYRPPYQIYVPMIYNGGVNYCLIATSGEVTPTAPNNGLVIFECISFPV
jgi:hypothetical protein